MFLLSSVLVDAARQRQVDRLRRNGVRRARVKAGLYARHCGLVKLEAVGLPFAVPVRLVRGEVDETALRFGILIGGLRQALHGPGAVLKHAL